MAINPNCDRCGQELTQYGALLFSPPNREGDVHKYHICVDCYKMIINEFKEE